MTKRIFLQRSLLAFSLSMLAVFSLSPVAYGQSLRDIQVSAAVDLLHPISLEDQQVDRNKLDVRSAELSFFGPVDPLFDANLTMAGHTEEGEFIYEVHEAFAGSSKLIPRSRFRAGKFFLGVGRLNQYHQHDWPFTSAPKVQREFLSPGSEPLEAEGAIDTGFEYSALLPTPFFLDLTIGVTNGYCFGHCHGEGRRPQVPVHYLHPVTFFELGEGKGLQLGASYLGRTDFAGEQTTLTGLDATFKSREGKTMKWLLQSEVWHQAVNSPAGATSTVGAYVYNQYGLDETLALGLRLDGFSQLNRAFSSTGEKQKDFDYGIVPVITYRSSEFATLRVSYSHEVDTTQGEGDIMDRRFELQFVYILGAHPAHDF